MANGHGTLITSSDGQGNVKVEVYDTGGDKSYSTGKQEAIVASGVKVNKGDKVSTAWDDRSKSVVVNGIL
ncbi:MAG: hypothetical protein H6603_11770 [Flavobacteriales bacterium]|nr:hypothetical protein [Flavobacteriales bacterium]MCB9205648.1 hypothetical protein [Flavobacteriales bacterium]